jgi:signal transduction histidine kinase
LIDRWSRLTARIKHVEPIVMAGFLQEVADAAALDARARGVRLTVLPDDRSVAVEADRQILSSVVGNLLQNAIKFTRADRGPYRRR